MGIDLILDLLNIPPQVADLILNVLEDGQGIAMGFGLARNGKVNGGLLAEIATNLLTEKIELLPRECIEFFPNDLPTHIKLVQGAGAISKAMVVGHDRPVGFFVGRIDIENGVRDVSGGLGIPLGKLSVHHLLK